MNKIVYLSNEIGKFGKLQVQGLPIEAKAASEADFHKPMRQGISILNNLGYSYFISAGTALGFIRDNAFISHDKDIDIEIVTDYNTFLNYQELVNSFIKEDFFVVRTVFDGNFAQQIAFMNKEFVVFDIWFIYKDVIEGHYVNHTEYGRMKTPESFIENIKVTKILVEDQEYDLPMPFPLEEYCECRYGSDWMTPKTYKGPWQNDAGNLE